MNVSQEMQSLFQKYKEFTGQTEKCDMKTLGRDSDHLYDSDDVIDVNEIDMNDDQNWLTETDPTVVDLDSWLYAGTRPHNVHLTTVREKPKFPNTQKTKNIDTRTFTRPKKKYSRPSIEKYNEEFFENEMRTISDQSDSYISLGNDGDDIEERPLHFDLSQPTSGSFFDKILSTAPELDSFQNMSPPSLVNSMCSSTFTNLMENSYIKNDPVLREIRDADYSQEIFLDAEPPLYQSITGSCSSINSEVAENFVRKTLLTINGSLNTSAHEEDTIKRLHLSDDIITNGSTGGRFSSLMNDYHTENIDPNISQYVTSSLLNPTFNKSNNSIHNSTFEKYPDDKLNTTFNKVKDCSIEKKSFITEDLNITLNKLSEKEREQLNNLDENTISKSGDNLTFEKDYDDSSRNHFNGTFRKNTSSKEQNNLNNTFQKASESNNLNETFEKRVPLRRNNLDNNYATYKRDNRSLNMQPKKRESINLEAKDDTYRIRNESINMKRLSMEIDDFLTEKMNCAQENDRLQSNSSHRLSADSSDSLDRLSNYSNSSRESRHMLMSDVDAIVEQQERSLQVMSTPKPAKSLTKLFENTCLSPIPNLNLKEHLSDSEISSDEYKTMRSASSAVTKTALERNVRSLNNLKNPSEMIKPRGVNTLASGLANGSKFRIGDSKLKGSYSNLKTFNSNLKKSYTNLKPLNSNLPNIPSRSVTAAVPKVDPNITQTLEGPKTAEVFKVPSNASANGTFVKPQASKLSGLPRPVSSATGIPRPSMSKIPGPRTLRVSSARQLMRPSSKVNVNDGFY